MGAWAHEQFHVYDMAVFGYDAVVRVEKGGIIDYTHRLTLP